MSDPEDPSHLTSNLAQPVSDELINDVRVYVFEEAAETARVPTPSQIGDALGLDLEEVHSALEALAQGRVIILAPYGHNIWAADPFGAVPTDFKVLAANKVYWAICIWDALGIPAAVGEDAVIETSCPDCREPLTLEVVDGELARTEGVINFVVPAHSFWDNIAYT